MTSGPDGPSSKGFSASGFGGGGRDAAGERKSHETRCVPAVTGPVKRRTTRPDESLIVKITAGASSSSSARRSAELGKVIAVFFLCASLSASCRFDFLVLSSSF